MKNILKKKVTRTSKEEGHFGDLKKIDKTIYFVRIIEGLGSVPREIKTFQTNRFRDPEDDVVYLASEKLDFFEIFPTSKDQVINFTKSDCKAKIAHFKKKLATELNTTEGEDSPNTRSIEMHIKKWEAKARYFQYNHTDASYLYFNEDNYPSFCFKRVGSDMVPIAWDLSTEHLFIMSDTRKKTIKISRDRKEKKYKGADSIFKTIGFGVLIFSLLIFCISIYTYQKSNQLYSQNEFNALKAENIALQQQCTEITINSAESISEIAEKLNTQLKPTQETTIEGIIPQ